MKKRLLFLIAPIIALILECLPGGVIMIFADGPDSTFTETYSYFGLTPIFYGMYGPFLTVIMTCVIIILSLIYVFTAKRGLKTAIMVLAVFGMAFSVLPLLMFILGVEEVTVINVIVALLLFAEAAMLLVKAEEKSQ